ncbi:hypothetical protein DPMN_097872 [Dreissena polymorpha]|uniref:Uncharacterized protein n=1 Tax=Dreissena polymorpha TaxID=45954 RepID=A0A9D4LBY6_DREPO|nr:hypothetical protein DPMN_097872 [Dreissena polymorpha]
MVSKTFKEIGRSLGWVGKPQKHTVLPFGLTCIGLNKCQCAGRRSLAALETSAVATAAVGGLGSRPLHVDQVLLRPLPPLKYLKVRHTASNARTPPAPDSPVTTINTIFVLESTRGVVTVVVVVTVVSQYLSMNP